MAHEDLIRRSVDRFILEAIDTVPHLEALLLLWNSKPNQWSGAEMSKALYISVERSQGILEDLHVRQLIAKDSDRYFYNSEPNRDSILENVDSIYRHEIVRISTMIHSKAPSAVREFARAFRLKKD